MNFGKKEKKESKFRAFIKKHFAIIVLIAILTIPSIYTVLFLGSMWDPYGNTGSLPVAVVNEDVSVNYNDKTLDVGKQMCKTLKANDSLQFNFVNRQVALDGLDNGTYYMVIVIPNDFSYNATTLTSEKPTKMELEYYTNPGNNYIASKISNSAANTIKASINESVINTYARTVFDSIITAGNGFQEAADGAGQIETGLGTLGAGNNTLAAGMKTLSNGCLTLKDGTKALQEGSATLLTGINDYTDGVSQVYSGTQQLMSNNDKLNEGAAQINAGLHQVSNTIGDSLPQSTQDDLVTLEEGLITINDGIQTLNSSVNEGETGEKINKALKELDKISTELDTFVQSDTYQYIKQYNPNKYLYDYNVLMAEIESQSFWTTLTSQQQTAIKTQIKSYYDDASSKGIDMSKLQDVNLENMSIKLTSLDTSLNSLTSGIKQLSDGGNKALPAASDALKSLSSGLLNVKSALDMTKEKDGKTGLIEGMTTLQKGLGQYSDGVTQVDAGVSKLNYNSSKLKSGAKMLNDGAKKLNSGSKELYNGSVKLIDGDKQISGGIDKLSKGSNKLKTSLQAGADTVKSNNTDDSVTDMFASPVNATEKQVTSINNNGEAMAAYMMCAGLWVGCLAFCLMFSPYNSYLANRKGQKQFLRFAFISVFVAVAQALLMVTLIMQIDGMAPQHVIQTFIMAVMASLAFMSIVYFCNTLMGPVGSFVLLVLLVFQLSGAAGTYPIELSPKFYQVIHPFLPFTYGVSAFRSTISTGTSLWTPILVFGGITAVFWLFTAITFFVRSHNQIKAAKKEIDDKFEEEMAYYNAEMQQ